MPAHTSSPSAQDWLRQTLPFIVRDPVTDCWSVSLVNRSVPQVCMLLPRRAETVFLRPRSGARQRDGVQSTRQTLHVNGKPK